MPNPQIYHITHVDNLPSLANNGGIICDSVATAKGLTSVAAAHENIKERRRRKQINVGPQGTLADYAPFYFAPRSPMLGAISVGSVAGYTGRQSDIVHLVVNVDDVVAQGLPFVFTDGHAEMALSGQYTNLADLTKIDWELMGSRYWNATNSDPDRPRRRQAEFLIHQQCPWNLVSSIGVMNDQAAALVQEALQGTPVPNTTVHQDWYY